VGGGWWGLFTRLAFPTTRYPLPPLRIVGVIQDRLDVHHRRPVNQLDRPNSQPRPGNLPHRYSMKPQGVGPVGRPGRENSGDRNLRITPRVHLEHLTIATM